MSVVSSAFIASSRRLTRVSSSPFARSSVRHKGEHVGPWPGPNPLRDIIIGLGLGCIGAAGWKYWQINDKAVRIEFYQQYRKAQKEAALIAAQSPPPPLDSDDSDDDDEDA